MYMIKKSLLRALKKEEERLWAADDGMGGQTNNQTDSFFLFHCISNFNIMKKMAQGRLAV